ncbi:NYN domain-containing protein [Catellatospora coxensis]
MTVQEPADRHLLPRRYTVLVDVGYLYAASGELLLGTSNRSEFKVDAERMIHALMAQAASCLGADLLRLYWFDAARDRVPTIDQRVIAQMAQVKLRLGNLNLRGQQKGVDAQIRSDLETLARHRSVTDAVLVAGDEDMLSAVEGAQSYGVRVHLWGVEPPYGTNQAERLVWESDTVYTLDADFVRPYFTATGRIRTPTPAEVFSGRPAIALPAAQVSAPRSRARCRPRAAGSRNRRSAPSSSTSASTWPRSGSSPAAVTTSATCCRGRCCRRSSTRSCWWRRRRSSASRCAPSRRHGCGSATASGRGCIEFGLARPHGEG